MLVDVAARALGDRVSLYVRHEVLGVKVHGQTYKISVRRRRSVR